MPRHQARRSAINNAAGRIPKYRLHKPSGRAVVTLNGRDFHLGRNGSVASLVNHDRVIRDWLAKGRRAGTQLGLECRGDGKVKRDLSAT